MPTASPRQRGSRFFFRHPRAYSGVVEMPKGWLTMSICPRTGLTRPECSCSRCLTEQVRQFQPALLESDPATEIRMIHGSGTSTGETGSGRRAAA